MMMRFKQRMRDLTHRRGASLVSTTYFCDGVTKSAAALLLVRICADCANVLSDIRIYIETEDKE